MTPFRFPLTVETPGPRPGGQTFMKAELLVVAASLDVVLEPDEEGGGTAVVATSVAARIMGR